MSIIDNNLIYLVHGDSCFFFADCCSAAAAADYFGVYTIYCCMVYHWYWYKDQGLRRIKFRTEDCTTYTLVNSEVLLCPNPRRNSSITVLVMS